MKEYLSEFKVTWEELAPSLQRILQGLEQYIMDSKQKLETERANRIHDFSQLDTEIRNLSHYDFKENYDGYTAQVKAINKRNNATYWADIFQMIKFTTNNSETTTTQSFGIDLKNIFDNWIRYTHFDSSAIHDYLDHSNWEVGGDTNGKSHSQNDWAASDQNVYLDHSKSGWRYDADVEYIQATVDNKCAAGFISPDVYEKNWRIKTLIDVGWDDDNLMIVVGYCKDKAGVEHTLSVVRGAGLIKGGIDTFFWWGLIYDMCNPTQYILVNKSNVTGHSPQPTDYAGRYLDSPSHTYCYIQAERQDTHYVFKTSQFNRNVEGDTYLDPNFDIVFDFPSSNPGWPQQMYENMKKMCTKPSNVGFGVRSGMPRFKVLEAEGIFQDKNYDAGTGQIYKYDWITKTWYPIGSIIDSIKPRTIIYNYITKRMYWYLGADNYEELRF